MKTRLVIFLLIFGILLSYIFTQKERINSDIFALVSIQKDDIFKSLNQTLSHDINMLLPDENALQTVKNLNNQLNIFSKFEYKIENIDNFKKELKLAKLALFKGEINDDFIQNSLEQIYSGVSTRILSIGDDFFDLASFSSLILQNTNIKINFNNGYFMSKDNKYIYAKATLKDGYDDKLLLNFYHKMRALNAKLSGGALYSAFGKQNGAQESAIMSIVGTTASILFLLLAFKNFKVFFIFLAPIFGILSGLSACFLFFENVHILSIVISTSLVGLMLDYSCGWLGLNFGQKIIAKSIKSAKNMLLTALAVSCSGYLLFLLSPMDFLHQIAIFSIFALLGAFATSYFLIPNLLEGTHFNPTNSFYFILKKIQKIYLNFAFLLKKIWFLATLILISIVCIAILILADFNENIKNYTSINKELFKQSQEISQITGLSSDFKFITADIQTQDKLIKKLYSNGLIKSYVSLYSIINPPSKQEKIVKDINNLFLNKQDLFEGLNIQDKLNKLKSSKILTENELKKLEILKNFSIFFNYPNIIMVSKVIANDKFYNILNKYNANYYDLAQSINENFTKIKINAIYIKFFAFILAFTILFFTLDLKKATLIIGITIFNAIVVLGIFTIISHVDIFVIFGIILASAVGIDYLLLAFKNADFLGLTFGIVVAGGTSIITFLTLILSNTAAVANFGASISISIAINIFFALGILGLRSNKL